MGASIGVSIPLVAAVYAGGGVKLEEKDGHLHPKFFVRGGTDTALGGGGGTYGTDRSVRGLYGGVTLNPLLKVGADPVYGGLVAQTRLVGVASFKVSERGDIEALGVVPLAPLPIGAVTLGLSAGYRDPHIQGFTAPLTRAIAHGEEWAEKHAREVIDWGQPQPGKVQPNDPDGALDLHTAMPT